MKLHSFRKTILKFLKTILFISCVWVLCVMHVYMPCAPMTCRSHSGGENSHSLWHVVVRPPPIIEVVPRKGGGLCREEMRFAELVASCPAGQWVAQTTTLLVSYIPSLSRNTCTGNFNIHDYTFSAGKCQAPWILVDTESPVLGATQGGE